MEPKIRIHQFADLEEEPTRQPMVVPPRKSRTPLVVLLVLLLAGVGVWLVLRYRVLESFQPRPATTSQSGYQAVFLTNGQVYFGKLSDEDKTYATLTDIYYLQALQPPLQGQKSDTNQAPQLSLVKLGNELHGPVDEMKISRSQILFYEDLKNDSQVVKAIQNYTNGQNSQQKQ